MNRIVGHGHHRGHRPLPGVRPAATRVLREAEAGDLSVDELRAFLADVDEVAEAAGVDPGGLRLWVAVRFSGAVRAVCVKVPARKQPPR